MEYVLSASHLASTLIVAAASALLATSVAHANGLQAQVESALRSAQIGQTTVGIVAIDLDTGSPLVEIEGDRQMIPASNMKLVTTAAALEMLGPDFTFRTRLQWIPTQRFTQSGAPAPEHPTLLVVGDGDPAFGDSKTLALHEMEVEQLLDLWVAAARKTGEDHFGELVIDDRVFDRQWVHPTWDKDELHRWWSAPVAGLNFHDNCLDVYPSPTRPGEAPRIIIRPEAPFLTTINRATTGNSTTFDLLRAPGTNRITFRGLVKHRSRSPFHVTMHDPPMLFAQFLQHRLKSEGIQVDRVRRIGDREALPEATDLHIIQTTLPVVLKRCNTDSQNLFAEALVKRMGRHFTGMPGSWENGRAAVRNALVKLLGARASSVNMADGSGLSRDNRVTPRILAQLLATVAEDDEAGPIFKESLSFADHDTQRGTLDRRNFDTPRHAAVYAKTGYIRGVSALSGYLDVSDPNSEQVKTIVFSMLFNDVKPPVYGSHLTKAQEMIVELLTEHAEQELEAFADHGN